MAEKRYQVERGELGKADRVPIDKQYETWLTTYKIPNTKESSSEPTNIGMNATFNLLLATAI